MNEEAHMEPTTIAAIVNAVPLAFIGWLFISLSRRIDKLHEFLAGQQKS